MTHYSVHLPNICDLLGTERNDGSNTNKTRFLLDSLSKLHGHLQWGMQEVTYPCPLSPISSNKSATIRCTHCVGVVIATLLSYPEEDMFSMWLPSCSHEETQLEWESKPMKDTRGWSHPSLEDCLPKIQKWFPWESTGQEEEISPQPHQEPLQPSKLVL